MNTQNRSRFGKNGSPNISIWSFVLCISRIQQEILDKIGPSPLTERTCNVPFLCEAIVGAGLAGLGLVLTNALNTVSSIQNR